MIAEKQCSCCKLILPVLEFYVSKKNKSGLASQCKTCHKQWQKDNKDRRSVICKKYNTKPESKIKKNTWTNANREKLNQRSNELRTLKRWEGRVRQPPIGRSESIRRYYATHRAKWANDRTVRQVNEKQATSAWANKKSICSIYAMAKWLSDVVGIKYHVDHVVPLRNKDVCGLHNEYNLAIRPAFDNLKKGNRYWPNMP